MKVRCQPLLKPMTRVRGRVSIPKEDRIWSLRCQGYDMDSIARITNVSPSTPSKVVRRVRRRPPIEVDPIRRGRRCGFLSDAQVSEIRFRNRMGETQFNIAKDFDVDVTSINRICTGRSYAKPCDDETSGNRYPFSFGNRLRMTA